MQGDLTWPIDVEEQQSLHKFADLFKQNLIRYHGIKQRAGLWITRIACWYVITAPDAYVCIICTQFPVFKISSFISSKYSLVSKHWPNSSHIMSILKPLFLASKAHQMHDRSCKGLCRQTVSNKCKYIEKYPACSNGIETVHRQDSSPTRILKTVHWQNWRLFTDRIEDSSSTNFILYLYGTSQFSPFNAVKMNEDLI